MHPMKVASALGALVALMAHEPPAWAGPPHVTFGSAPTSKDAFVANADGHGHEVVLTVSAEGLVDGKRVTQALKPVAGGAGAWAVPRNWPQKGKWIVVASAKAIHGEGGKATELINTCMVAPVASAPKLIDRRGYIPKATEAFWRKGPFTEDDISKAIRDHGVEARP